MTKAYSHLGLAGLVMRRRNHRTSSRVSLYHGAQAGLDLSEGCTWATVCEDHGVILGHQSIRLARTSLSRPDDWCEGCSKLTQAPKESWEQYLASAQKAVSSLELNLLEEGDPLDVLDALKQFQAEGLSAEDAIQEIFGEDFARAEHDQQLEIESLEYADEDDP